MKPRPRLSLVLVAALCFAATAQCAAADDTAPKKAPVPTVGKPAPAFTLADLNQKKRSLAEFRGRPVALFFFCGCSWCEAVAKEWATLQRTDALKTQPEGKPGAKPGVPITLVVYSELETPTARELSAYYGLDATQTVTLPDPRMDVTQTLYHADPCPRVFVIDPSGVLRYTNNHQDDTPRKAPALAITSRALDALRTAIRDKPSSKE